MLCGGEALPSDLAEQLLHGSAPLWNLYGPTETNVCTYHRVEEVPEDDRPIPIGRACENTEVSNHLAAVCGALVFGEPFMSGRPPEKVFPASPKPPRSTLDDAVKA